VVSRVQSLRHAVALSARLTRVAIIGVALSSATPLAHADAANDKAAIASLIGVTWDKPDAKVQADPIVVVGSYAIAGWTQGERGGRALLRRKDDKWSVVLCSGDPLKEASSLVEAGMNEKEAKQLSAELAQAEAKIDPNRRAQFSLFSGTVSLEDNGATAHDAHHKH
jgi:hypothetical protein